MANIRIARIILFALICLAGAESRAAAEDFTVDGAEPYDEKATPQWVKDMRRGEIITLGSWPFTTLMTGFTYSFAQMVAHGWNSSYFKNPFSSSGDGYSFNEAAGILITSFAISVGIGVTDLIVNIVKRRRAERENNARSLRDITITPLEDGGRFFGPDGARREYIFGNLESAVF